MLKINSETTTKSDVILRRGFVYKISRKPVWRSLVEDHSRLITQGRSSTCFASFVLASSFGLSTSFLAALRAISFMRKRLQNQGRISRKRSPPTRPATEQTPQITAYACSTPTRPATEQTPEIPAHAEATMHDSGNASILRCSDTAVEPDAATEHIGMAWLSTSDDVTLIAIFEHFANCYVAMPMVGTCKRIFTTWTRKRRQLALEELTKLRCWFYKQDISVPISISIVNRIEALIK